MVTDLIAAPVGLVFHAGQNDGGSQVVDPAAEHPNLESSEQQPLFPLAESDGRVQQPSSTWPNANLVGLLAMVDVAQQACARVVFRRKGCWLRRRAGDQGRLGPVRAVPAGIVLRAGMRFELQPNALPGERAQVDFRLGPLLGRRVFFVDNPPEGAGRGIQFGDANAKRHAVALSVGRNRMGKS